MAGVCAPGIPLLLLMQSNATIADRLTKFLKDFKACLHSQICFIEYCFSGGTDDEKCKRVQEMWDEYYQLDQESSSMSIGRQSLKVVERFFLRVNQYIEYRFNAIKVQDRPLINEFLAFKKALSSVYFEVNKDPCGLKLSDVLFMFCEVQNRYAIRIYSRLLSQSSILSLPPSLQESVNKAIQTRIVKTLRFAQKDKSPTALSVHSTNDPGLKKMGSFFREANFITTKPRKSARELPNLGTDSECHFGEGRSPSKKRSQINQKSMLSLPLIAGEEEERSKVLPHSVELRKTEQQAMEVEVNSSAMRNQEQLMKQLRNLNKKNESMIQKYGRLCQKKRKKWNLGPQRSETKIEKGSSRERSTTLEDEAILLDVKPRGILPMIRRGSKI